MKAIQLLLIAVSAFASIALSSCNTIHGAGQDVAHAGRAVEHASDAAH